LIYAAKAEESARAQQLQVAAGQVRDAIEHLEQVDRIRSRYPTSR
jgi:hypothetical protein